MASLNQRTRRFSLLAKLQKTRVETAAQSYRLVQQNLKEAKEKLSSLERYFTDGPVQEQKVSSPVVLKEASVFGARLGDAIAAQKTLCQQLSAQSELSRQFLLTAEKRRVGLTTVLDRSVREQKLRHEKIDQRRAEDNLMANCCRPD